MAKHGFLTIYHDPKFKPVLHNLEGGHLKEFILTASGGFSFYPAHEIYLRKVKEAL